MMSRAHVSPPPSRTVGPPPIQITETTLQCGHCRSALECVDQNRRSGTWLGSFMCPNCRTEYFYAYRWGRLTRKL
jgi:hypothetical protein